MTTDSEVAAYDALMDLGLLEPIKERMQWEIEGEKQTRKVLEKIEGKIADGKELTGFERSLYRVETGLVDYVPGFDDGEERVIRNYE